MEWEGPSVVELVTEPYPPRPTTKSNTATKPTHPAIAMCCADCTKRLLVIKYDNLMGIKSKIDALTDHL